MTRTHIGRLVPFTAAIALVAAACNNTSPRSSGLPLPSAVGGGNGTMSGNVKSYSTGGPVAGASVRLGTAIAVTDAAGNFTLTGTPTNGAGVVTAVLPGYVYRGVSFTLASSRTNLLVDLLPDAAPFNLTFYRQLVRNGAAGSSLEPLRRWTVNPNFYFQQVTGDTAVRVPDEIIQSIKTNLLLSVPELSGGKIAVGTFDAGDTPRDPPADGWVNVVFYRTLANSPLHCGSGDFGCSTVGGNSATIALRYDPAVAVPPSFNPFNCSTIQLAVADHEISHTMGYWHTDDALNDTASGTGCPGTGRREQTRYHAGVAYSRPVGNIDPDVDPTTSAHALAPGGAYHPIVRCDLAAIFRR